MENQQAQQPPAAATRRELSIDPVKAQGILKDLTRKERAAAKAWHERWSFYGRVRQIQEEEAVKLGMSLEQYRTALQQLRGRPEPRRYPVEVDPSPHPLPRTSSGMVGRRAQCPLERYGRIVKTSRDHPIHPPLPPGQVYDPYKQTFIFLGLADIGDPISYKLPPATSDVTDEMWAEPRAATVMPFCQETLEQVFQYDDIFHRGHRQHDNYKYQPYK